VAGSIRQRGKESWELRVFVGRDPATDKKQYLTKTFRGTRRDAERELARLVVQADDGQVAVRGGTLAELCEQWYAHREADWSPATAYNYRKILDRRIIPRFGSTQLRKLRTVEIDAWYADLRKQGGKGGRPLDADTVKRIHNVLHVALKQGVRWGFLTVNPSDNATQPRATKHEAVLPEPADVLHLVETSAKVNYALPYFLRLAAVTGARRGELCGLQWKHVDQKRRQLTITRSILQLPGTPLIEKDTKSHASRRIGLDGRTLALLTELRQKQADRAASFEATIKDDGYVFSHEIDASKPWKPGYATLAFGRLAKQLDLTGVRLHDLRHFVATLMLSNGQDVRTVSGRLGHANAATTLSVYAHFVDAADHKAADWLGGLLDQAAGDESEEGGRGDESRDVGRSSAGDRR